MNKAFVREADAVTGRCPRCQSPGVAVSAETLAVWLPADKLADLGRPAYYCAIARCNVSYFDDFERFVEVADLTRSAWPKDPAAPICGCFDFFADDVAADVHEGSVARVKAAVARANSADSRCRTMSPTGKNCAAEIQRYFFRLKSQA